MYVLSSTEIESLKKLEDIEISQNTIINWRINHDNFLLSPGMLVNLRGFHNYVFMYLEDIYSFERFQLIGFYNSDGTFQSVSRSDALTIPVCDNKVDNDEQPDLDVMLVRIFEYSSQFYNFFSLSDLEKQEWLRDTYVIYERKHKNLSIDQAKEVISEKLNMKVRDIDIAV